MNAEKVTPVKYLSEILCRTCGRTLENAKDRYRLFGSQEFFKILEAILEYSVEEGDATDYLCSSCKAKLQRYSRSKKENMELTEFFKGRIRNVAADIQTVRFKRGRNTPPNPDSSVSMRKKSLSSIQPKAQKSINFTELHTDVYITPQNRALATNQLPLVDVSEMNACGPPHIYTSTSPRDSTTIFVDKSTQTPKITERGNSVANTNEREEGIEVCMYSCRSNLKTIH